MSQGNQPGRLQTYNLNLPVLLLLFLIFTVLGGGLTFIATQIISPSPNETAVVVLPTDTMLPPTATVENLETPVVEEATPEPQATLPPLEYTVQSGDTCYGVADFFDISVTELVTVNGLSASYCAIYEGDILLIPQPTPMPTSDAQATTSARLTEVACPIDVITVQEGETIDAIANFTGVPASEILEWNGKTSNMLYAGETLEIPTCKIAVDENGSTLTPSPAPTYTAPEILQPPRGSVYTQGDTIVLQWAAPAELRDNEYFVVTIYDTTNGNTIVLQEYLKETSLIVPEELRPGDSTHIFSWTVGVVAHIGEDSFGEWTYRESGPDSEVYYFAWE